MCMSVHNSFENMDCKVESSEEVVGLDAVNLEEDLDLNLEAF